MDLKMKSSVSMSGLKDTAEGELFKTPFFNPPKTFVEIEVEEPVPQEQLKQQLDVKPLESEMYIKKRGTLSRLTGKRLRSVSDLPRPTWDIFGQPSSVSSPLRVSTPAEDPGPRSSGNQDHEHEHDAERERDANHEADRDEPASTTPLSPSPPSGSPAHSEDSDHAHSDISILSLAATAGAFQIENQPRGPRVTSQPSSPFAEFSFAEGMGTLKRLAQRKRKTIKATLSHDSETSRYASILSEQRTPDSITTKSEAGRRLVMDGTPEDLLRLLGMQLEVQTDYVDVFLCTFRYFTTPTEVLNSLMTCHREFCIDITSEDTQMMDKGTVIDWNESVEKHIMTVFVKWYTGHYHDFAKDEELDNTLRDFLRSDIFEVSTRVNIPTILEKLDNVKEGYGKWLQETKLMIQYRLAVEKNGAVVMRKTSTKSVLDLNVTAAVKALCQLEMDILSKIPAWEFCSLAWVGKNCEHDAPLLYEHIYLFNKISNWVATEIVMETNMDHRVSLIEKFIAMARQAREWNNFNTSFQLVLGLHNPAVLKLKLTWAKVGRRYVQALKEVNDIVSPEKNHRVYRILLSRTAPPCVPYVGLYLKDLTFANEGSKTVLPNGNINFGKLNTIGMTILAIRRFQGTLYPFEDETLIHWFRHHTFAMSDEELLIASKRLNESAQPLES